MSNLKLNVLVSRPLEKLEGIPNLLPQNRFNIWECPLIDIHPVEKNKSYNEIFSHIDQYDYLIFTSQYSVVETFEYLNFIKVDPNQYRSLRICAVGPMVSQQLTKFGVAAHMIPQRYTAQSLANLFPPAPSRHLKVLFPKGNKSAGVLEGELSRKGYEVTAPVVYVTELRNSLDRNAEKLIYSKEVDCIAFTSPSSVLALASILGPKMVKDLLNDVAIAAIGPSSFSACKEAGLKVEILPTEYTVQGMIRAVARFYSKN